ncbi:MAG: TetR/AcrR family transcriptional regulator [Actinobacteria bacterium]|nr:MAG: TetR/AcrR family transcriptional regulator [Actinomycetota bacterium]
MTSPLENAIPRRRGRPRLDDEMVPAILDAAERLFSRRDSLDVGIRDIAAEAGIPHSAIYRYFDSKDQVLARVLERGRQRQIEHDDAGRSQGAGTAGAFEWITTSNRAYAVATMRAALAGQTPSTLGLDPARSSAGESIKAIEAGGLGLTVRTDHDPAVTVAATMAFMFGWVAAEDWILESTGLQGCDRAALHVELDSILESLAALGNGPRRVCVIDEEHKGE